MGLGVLSKSQIDGGEEPVGNLRPLRIGSAGKKEKKKFRGTELWTFGVDEEDEEKEHEMVNDAMMRCWRAGYWDPGQLETEPRCC